MWPWGHLAVAYLLYSLGRRQQGRRPRTPEVYLLALGALVPDLVDKLLAWELGVLASGRSLGHSVLVGLLLLAVLYHVLAPRLGRSRVIAFGVGYLSHPLADVPFADLLAGEFATSAYVAWPLLAVPPDPLERSLFAYILAFQPGPYDYVQGGLALLALGLWYADGMPGWRNGRPASGQADEPATRK